MNDAGPNETPLVSVVLATYNGERYLERAIQSVLDQTFTNFEFIIVNDGSTDTTSSLVKSIRDERVILVQKEKNTGIADSLNLGIHKAKGKYIARMDDDDICDPRRLESQLRYLEKNPDVTVCGTELMNAEEKGKHGKYRSHDEICAGLLFQNVITHPSVMMPREVFDYVEYKSEFIPSEDYHLWLQIMKSGRFVKLKEPLLEYTIHVGSETSKRRLEQLNLNIGISRSFLELFGFSLSPYDEVSHASLISHDYKISGIQLNNIINWMSNLNEQNYQLGKIPVEIFNAETETQLKTFIIKYFLNRSFKKKIIPFLRLPYRYKVDIIRHYFNKLRKRPNFSHPS